MSWIDELSEAYALPSMMAMAGETVVYTPREGSPRTITATVLVTSRREEINQEAWQVERALVTCQRDATLGIDAPQVGEKILPPESKDPLQRGFTFQGEKLDVLAAMWTLVFERRTKTVASARR